MSNSISHQHSNIIYFEHLRKLLNNSKIIFSFFSPTNTSDYLNYQFAYVKLFFENKING